MDRAQLGAVWLASSTFADEAADWGVAPRTAIFKGSYHSKTPTSVPGARTITTGELKGLIDSNPRAVLIDVLEGSAHPTLPFATWLKGAGLGDSLDDSLQARLADKLSALTDGSRARPLVFFCLSAECWLSYNATLRAAALGYTDVAWYRGGQAAWLAAGLPMVTAESGW